MKIQFLCRDWHHCFPGWHWWTVMFYCIMTSHSKDGFFFYWWFPLLSKNWCKDTSICIIHEGPLITHFLHMLDLVEQLPVIGSETSCDKKFWRFPCILCWDWFIFSCDYWLLVLAKLVTVLHNYESLLPNHRNFIWIWPWSSRGEAKASHLAENNLVYPSTSRPDSAEVRITKWEATSPYSLFNFKAKFFPSSFPLGLWTVFVENDIPYKTLIAVFAYLMDIGSKVILCIAGKWQIRKKKKKIKMPISSLAELGWIYQI